MRLKSEQVPRELGSDEKAVVSTVAGLSSDNEYFSVCLVSLFSVTQSSPRFQHHAYNHLSNLVNGSATVRKVVYGDTKYNPNIWTTILDTVLGVKCLAGDQAELTRRGGKYSSWVSHFILIYVSI
jgi:hypothetical protein